MLTQSQRAQILIVVLVLFLPVILLQSRIDPLRPQYEPGGAHTGQAVKQLPIEFAFGAVTGFREAVAGLLWVRTDEFFHNGDYEAITPMIRIITWLDPHQVDVYQTGAWHMDYNFTDTDQRSDRRYIPLSLSLMNEGIANNSDIPDLYSDLGFTHYFRKIADFPKAQETFEEGQKVADDIQNRAANNPKDAQLQAQAADARTSVTTIGHGLAHSLEAQGKIPQALAQWQRCIITHQQILKDKGGKDYSAQSGLDTSEKQYREMMLREKWRARDTKIPVDMHFTAQLVRVAPKIFVVKGTLNAIGATKFTLETGEAQWGPIDGCRIEIRLQDAGYKMPMIQSFSLSSLNLNPDTTIMQDSVSVRAGKYQRKIDMSQDPQMYSFTAPKYTVTFWFNPSNPTDCPPNVQDRIGWLGQGMTDQPGLIDTSGQVPGDTSTPIAGLHLIKKTIVLTRDDILGKTNKTVFE